MNTGNLIEKLSSCRNGAKKDSIETFLLGYRSARVDDDEEDTDIWNLVGPIPTNHEMSPSEERFDLEGLSRKLSELKGSSDHGSQENCGPEQCFLVFRLGETSWSCRPLDHEEHLVKAFTQLALASMPN